MAGRFGHRSRQLLAAAAVGAALLGAAACSPLTTQTSYAPSDGVRVALDGELSVENLLILTEAEGDPALVVGGFTNRSSETLTITMTFGEAGESTTVQVAAGDTVLSPPQLPSETGAAGAEGSVGHVAELIVLEASPGAPGSTVPVTVGTGSGGSATVEVPVLDGDLAPYGAYMEEFLSGQPAAVTE